MIMPSVSSLKVRELKAKCQELGLKNYSKLTRAALIDLINSSPLLTESQVPGQIFSNVEKFPSQQYVLQDVSSQVIDTGGSTPEHIAGPSGAIDRPSTCPSSTGATAQGTDGLPETWSDSREDSASGSATFQHPTGLLWPENETNGTVRNALTEKQARRRQKVVSAGIKESQVPDQNRIPEARRHGDKVRRQYPKVRLRWAPGKPSIRSPEPQNHDDLGLSECADLIGYRRYLSKSFVPKACIADGLEGQAFATARRFCISRFFLEGVFPTVLAATPVAGDVWRVEVIGAEVYVLGSTGESLGRELRADWASYVRAPVELHSLIKTKNVFDNPGGISRVFKGDRAIAWRAVLSSCAGESFCGPKIELTQMDAEYHGRPVEIESRTQAVQLYLPEAKQVISVHTQGMHTALAMVTRSTGDVDIVLRETGQVVGNEYELGEAWQHVLNA